ncbi:glutamine amidotransferase [Pararhizobium sp.]|uniref:glutamine amidotransferase n=1 Tax=Pararhizobium sp. TaxID=1977563 RepID=UPI003D0B34B5
MKAKDAGPDGLEAPEGIDPVIVRPDHPVLSDLTSALPFVLGMNRVHARSEAEATTLVHCPYQDRNLPLLSTRDYKAGRSLAWMTDIGPHWLSDEFMRWGGYDTLMANMVRWLAREL